MLHCSNLVCADRWNRPHTPLPCVETCFAAVEKSFEKSFRNLGRVYRLRLEGWAAHMPTAANYRAAGNRLTHFHSRTDRPVILSRILLAFMLVWAPALAHAGMNAAVATQHAQMMDHTGHCQMPPSSSADPGKSAGKICCASMGVAVTNNAATPIGESIISRTLMSSPLTRFHLTFLGEIATPPPRLL